MFICSIKASTLKLAAVITTAAVALGVVIWAAPEYTPKTTAAIAAANAEYHYDKIKTNEDRIVFLEQFGWKVDAEATEEVTMKIPREFDRVMSTYNELQKRQGLDLSKYKGREVTRYSYNVTNYPGYEGKVTASVIVYKSRVIGGDVSSSDVEGFIGTFEFPRNIEDMTGDGETGKVTE
ncbi:MAG: DUF4830 domain-containing protein [Clostridia bacterium]|nr:DUF4830 domain-containing protein [Clostridia bacterium]